ncbi:Spermatogenesis-associated protein 31 [Lemmus lemmus]
MENLPSLLESIYATWLSLSSTMDTMDIIFAIGCGLGLYLLLLPFIESRLSLSQPNIKFTRKPQMQMTWPSRYRKKFGTHSRKVPKGHPGSTLLPADTLASQGLGDIVMVGGDNSLVQQKPSTPKHQVPPKSRIKMLAPTYQGHPGSTLLPADTLASQGLGDIVMVGGDNSLVQQKPSTPKHQVPPKSRIKMLAPTYQGHPGSTLLPADTLASQGLGDIVMVGGDNSLVQQKPSTPKHQVPPKSRIKMLAPTYQGHPGSTLLPADTLASQGLGDIVMVGGDNSLVQQKPSTPKHQVPPKSRIKMLAPTYQGRARSVQMENLPSLLESIYATWLSLSSTMDTMDIIFAIGCGLGLYLLLLPFIESRLSLSQPNLKFTRKVRNSPSI